MDDDWSLPGYEVQGPLGDGTGEDLWRGRELASGDVVVLCRLPVDVGPATVQAWRQEASRQALVVSPHVVRLRAVVEHDARTVLVRDHAAGGGLAALVARRGVLEPGEVVTVGVALADALAALHEAGIASAGVGAERVLFRPDGMPLLVVAVAPGDGLSAAATGAATDVAALATLCGSLVGPGAPPEMVTVLSAGRSGDLDARAFGAALRRTCLPAPVRRGGATPPPVAPQVVDRRPRHAAVAPSRRRPSSRSLLPAGLVLLVLAGALAGWWSGRAGTAEPVSAAPSVSGAPSGSAVPSASAAPSGSAVPSASAAASGSPSSAGEWTAVLDRLDAARATAFAQADEALLAAVWAPGSVGLSGDRRLVRSLAERAVTAHDVRHDVRAVDVLAASEGHARLRVVDVLAAYDVRDTEGGVVSRAPARGDAAHVVELRRTADGWRLVDVRPE